MGTHHMASTGATGQRWFEAAVRCTLSFGNLNNFHIALIWALRCCSLLDMSGPTCRICSSPRRAEIDLDLVQGMSTVEVAKKYGDRQTNVARHKRLHLKPHMHAIGQVLRPLHASSPANTAALIPSVGTLLADLGDTVQRLKVLADDAEKDGGLGIRAISLRELRSGLTDATKLISVLRPPDAPPPSQINHSALADLFREVHDDDKSAILEKLAS